MLFEKRSTVSVSHNSVAQSFFSTPNKSSFEYYYIYMLLKFQRVLAEFKGNPGFFSEQMRQILRTWVYFIWFFIFIPLLPIFLFLFFFFWLSGGLEIQSLSSLFYIKHFDIKSFDKSWSNLSFQLMCIILKSCFTCGEEKLHANIKKMAKCCQIWNFFSTNLMQTSVLNLWKYFV